MINHDDIKRPTALIIIFLGILLVCAWTPLPIKDDRLVFLPGSQPGAVDLEAALRCDNCHGGYSQQVEPAHNWRGSMMSGAARDPLWIACLTSTLQDSIWALGNPNAGDICIRCHTPGGWLGGRSDPPNLTFLRGSDFEGVHCDSCHTLLDPIAGLRQLGDLPPETDRLAVVEAEKTFARDIELLSLLTLFDGDRFIRPGSALPVYFRNGNLPNFIEATAGEFFLDPGRPKRGPRYDSDTKYHRSYYSRFHKTKYSCATCHDVSNPVVGRLLSGDPALPEKQTAATFAHVERTFSEFVLSAYGQPGGAPANEAIALPQGMVVNKCQDCHMRNVSGKAASQPRVPVRDDLALHDQTGGNTWISGVLASLDATNPQLFNPRNYAILSGSKYPGARIDVAGIQGFGSALKDGQARALQQLRMAAQLVAIGENSTELTLRIVNNTGHKLISGFPEGRRMWLNVRFYGADGDLIDEINPYSPLVVNLENGAEEYVSGGFLVYTHEHLVFEAGMGSDITGEDHTFHFALGTHLYKDNRLPAKGFDIGSARARLVVPRWKSKDAPDYFTAEEYAGGYHDITVAKPEGTARWESMLFYQTTSREYIRFLRDEIEGTASTLPSTAYIAQFDPFFVSLKDWGKAIYELWLHNGGNEPVLMTRAESSGTNN
jgi:hypothetical protein